MNNKVIMKLFFTVFLFYSAGTAAQNRTTLFNNYIKQYSGIAVEEMKKYKIPASITLAQGLL